MLCGNASYQLAVSLLPFSLFCTPLYCCVCAKTLSLCAPAADSRCCCYCRNEALDCQVWFIAGLETLLNFHNNKWHSSSRAPLHLSGLRIACSNQHPAQQCCKTLQSWMQRYMGADLSASTTRCFPNAKTPLQPSNARQHLIGCSWQNTILLFQEGSIFLCA